MRSLLIRGGTVVDPVKRLREQLNILVADGLIVWVGRGEAPQPAERVLSAFGFIVSPGFVDLHCHLREPGFEHKETIATGTAAAAHGGFTTVCAMPNTQPPADNPSVLEYVLNKARSEGKVRVLPVACITKGSRGEELAPLGRLARVGAVAFSDDGSTVKSARLLRLALEFARELGIPVFEHCLDPELDGEVHEGWVAYRLGLKGSPGVAEEMVVARDIALARLTGARIHILHVSFEASVDLIRRAKEEGLPVTAEVTPHHLSLTEEAVLGYDTYAKVNPPLRTRRDVKALIRGLREGIIDAIATDHAPHSDEDKLVEFDLAAPGISGLETALPLLLDLVRRGELDLITIIAALTSGPCRVLGREPRGLEPGLPADLTIFDPEAEWTVTRESLYSKGKNTPLLGRTVRGKVMATLVEGEFAYLDPAIKVETVSEVKGGV